LIQRPASREGGGPEGEPWFPPPALWVGPALPGRLSCLHGHKPCPQGGGPEGEPKFPPHALWVGPALPGRLSCLHGHKPCPEGGGPEGEPWSPLQTHT